jgi:hypothetical protein
MGFKEHSPIWLCSGNKNFVANIVQHRIMGKDYEEKIS